MSKGLGERALRASSSKAMFSLQIRSRASRLRVNCREDVKLELACTETSVRPFNLQMRAAWQSWKNGCRTYCLWLPCATPVSDPGQTAEGAAGRPRHRQDAHAISTQLPSFGRPLTHPYPKAARLVRELSWSAAASDSRCRQTAPHHPSLK